MFYYLHYNLEKVVMKNSAILVVDDELQVRAITCRRLSSAGYEPTSAAGGEEAIVLLKQQRFDLVLLDIMMQGMSGIEVQREIRTNFPGLPVIMVTSEDDPNIAAKAFDLGARGYLVKPFSENELLIYISNVLRMLELENENREYGVHLEKQVAIRTSELEKALADLKSSQDQLIQQEKLATVGHLAAGIAHEINNPTGYIGSNLGTLDDHFAKVMNYIALLDDASRQLPLEIVAELSSARKKMKLDFIAEDIRDVISECQEGIERIRKIVQGLKSFSRKEEDTARPVNVNDCLENALTVAWNELKYKAEVKKEYGDLPLIECFPNQLGQVFINLLVNAAHAIEDRGIITIATKSDGDAVLVTISDTGCGIPAEIREKIFEPFYTTKKEGVGTGLGLSIIKEIIARHGGGIIVDPEPPSVAEIGGHWVTVNPQGRFILVSRDGRDTPIPVDEYRREVIQRVVSEARNLDEFRRLWIETQKRRGLINHLLGDNFSPEVIREIDQMADFDLYDFFGHHGYKARALKRTERGNLYISVNAGWFGGMDGKDRKSVV